MQFQMEIDNPRKRCRSLDDYEEEDHMAKKTRQSETYASARDSASPSPSDSAVSTPASIDESHDPFFSRPKPQSSGTIISGWNQARRMEDLRQRYPWLYGTQVSGVNPNPSSATALTVCSQ
ncbi:hypothetical protein QBC34DRAFT_400075 [Podospora aff. communis PSN243]|uniref:Uncharacterized protein n=1 Tax=Podospora aff. communis PSN243 TaxID=3040156 RepID=A0AAV9GUL9_9PEZI|nr:hypothetical protein QBC34DRAFT_400075 [Podospora aff. communis PSN243]